MGRPRPVPDMLDAACDTRWKEVARCFARETVAGGADGGFGDCPGSEMIGK